MTMFPSACIWTCREPLEQTLRQIKRTSFHYIDVEPESFDSDTARETLKSLGLKISCVVLDHKMPSGASLDGSGALRKAMDYFKQGLQKARDLGAQTAYITPCLERKHLKDFRAALVELADCAAQQGVKLCVEHVPGRALSTAWETLEFLDELNHPNACLLLDVGHTLLSRENAWEIIAAAGNRLGYVQLNDNNGKKDLHWPLLDGRLTAETLARILDALSQAGYSSTLGLELNEIRPGVMAALAKNRNLVLRMQMPVQPKSMKEPEQRRKP